MNSALRTGPQWTRTSGNAGLRLASVLIALSLSPGTVRAGCFSDVLRADGAFADQIERDPKGTVTAAESALASTAPQPAGGASRAQLYAVIMDARQNAEDIGGARDASARGLAALVATDSAGLRRRLELTGIKLLEQQGQIERAAAEYEQAAATVPEAAPDYVCVLGDRGYLRYLMGRSVDAATDAMRAYRLARDGGHRETQLAAGQLLARLYSASGLYDEALPLADEAVSFYAQSPKKVLLSDAYLFRGDARLNVDDLPAADSDFRRSRALLEAVGDRLALSFTMQRLCMVAARGDHRSDAPGLCSDAYSLAQAVKNPVTAKIVLTAMGLIEASRGRERAAVELWDRVLARDGVDIPRSLQARVYGFRGTARARLGDSAGALSDRNVYTQSLENDRKTRSAGQVALLNVKFALALKDEELAKLRAEQRSHELDASRQALIRDAIAAAAVATIVAIAALLSAWLWHRRKIAVDARAAAEERLAAVGRLTGGVAHDFNNLLSVIHQAAGLLALRESVKADAIAEQLVEQARRAARLCADITSQLLSFGTPAKPEPRTCRPGSPPARGPAATRACRRYVRQGGPRDHVPMPQAWVDRRQLTAALLNLVSNARDALPDGGTVTVRVTPDRDRMVRIDVVDDGHGMRPEVLARATEPFYSTKAVGDGSGLGLSMVHGFATQSGHALIVSAPNGGTTVSMRLPAADTAT